VRAERKTEVVLRPHATVVVSINSLTLTCVLDSRYLLLVWWEGSGSSKNPYKNAITNELFIVASVKAYLKTNTKSYLDDAIGAWKFCKSDLHLLSAAAHEAPVVVKDKMRRGDGFAEQGLYSEYVILHKSFSCPY
jgi:hypothetical protein